MGLFLLVFTTLIATALNGAKEMSYDRNVRPILSDRCFHCHGPELTDFSKENKTLIESYGPEVHKPVFFASNCLLAKRMAERDVHFIQLFHPLRYDSITGKVKMEYLEKWNPLN